MGPFRLLLRRAVRNGDDDAVVKLKRFILIIHFTVALALGSFGTMTDAINSNMTHLGFTYGGALVGVVTCVYMLVTRSMPLWVLELSCVAYTIVIVAGDWTNAAAVRATRVWPTVVLVMDALLTFGGRRLVQGICLHGTAVWLAVSALEDAFRLGLYDIEGVSEQPTSATIGRCSCWNPPCAVGATSGLGALGVAYVCLYLDFFATRGFAEGQREQQKRLKVSLDVTEQVASHLVAFDLDSAQTSLDTAPDGMPPALHSSCCRLLANLAGYRPYLPQSCFEVQGDGGDSEEGGPDDADTNRGSCGNAEAAAEDMASRRGSAWERGGPSPTQSPRGSVRSSMSPRSGGGVSSRSADSAGEFHRPAPRAAHAAIVKRVSLLACNRSGFLAAAAQGALEYNPWLANAVAHFCSQVLLLKGVTDTLCADHLLASFGALKNLGAHRIAATRCAVEVAKDPPQEDAEHEAPVRRLPFTSAVCSGMATCGDFGSASTQRYMVIGGVSALLPVIERAAAGWHAGTLVDTTVYSDAQMHWDFRLRQMITFAKTGTGSIMLWELVAAKNTRSGSQTEWMYELSRATANPWSVYNTVVTQWCTRDSAAALQTIDAQQARAGPDESSRGAEGRSEDSSAPSAPPPQVAKALAALRSAIAAGVEAPSCDVPAAAGLGQGAPLE